MCQTPNPRPTLSPNPESEPHAMLYGRANYYTGPKYNPHSTKRKWAPTPMPADVQCEQKSFVPLGCHKCWYWNRRTWRHMKETCPEVPLFCRPCINHPAATRSPILYIPYTTKLG